MSACGFLSCILLAHRYLMRYRHLSISSVRPPLDVYVLVVRYTAGVEWLVKETLITNFVVFRT